MAIGIGVGIGAGFGRFGALGSDANPPQIFLDTDFDSDIDDAVDLSLLLTLEAAGACKVVGICVSSSNAAAAGALYGMLNFYGRTAIPVGQNTAALGNNTSLYDGRLVSTWGVVGKVTSTDFEAGLSTYRRELANAVGKVIIITTGGLESLDALLNSSADGFSALNGLQLVAEKVEKIYIVAGFWPSGAAVSDMNTSRVAGADIFAVCPVPIIMNGIELGDQWSSGGGGVVIGAPLDDPLRIGWVAYFGNENPANARNGWSQSAIMAAVRGESGLLTRAGDNGQCTVNTSTGATLWNAAPNQKQGYFTFALAAANWPALVNGIITGAPKYSRPNLLANGNFGTNDLTGWDNDSIGTGTASGATGAGVLVGTNSANRGRISQAFNCEVGKRYSVVLTESGGNYNLAVEIVKNAADGPVTLVNVTPATSAPKVFTFVATAAVHRLRLENAAAGGTATFDNVAVYRTPT